MRALVEYLALVALPLAVPTVSGILMGKRRREETLILLSCVTDRLARRMHDRIADELDSLAVSK